jgi:hypothetical protein
MTQVPSINRKVVRLKLTQLSPEIRGSPHQAHERDGENLGRHV